MRVKVVLAPPGVAPFCVAIQRTGILGSKERQAAEAQFPFILQPSPCVSVDQAALNAAAYVRLECQFQPKEAGFPVEVVMLTRGSKYRTEAFVG